MEPFVQIRNTTINNRHNIKNISLRGVFYCSDNRISRVLLSRLGRDDDHFSRMHIAMHLKRATFSNPSKLENAALSSGRVYHELLSPVVERCSTLFSCICGENNDINALFTFHPDEVGISIVSAALSLITHYYATGGRYPLPFAN